VKTNENVEEKFGKLPINVAIKYYTFSVKIILWKAPCPKLPYVSYN